MHKFDSLSVYSGITGSLMGTASNAATSSYIEGNIEFPDGLDVTGSLVVTGGITGSLLGTSSFATTASYALNVVSNESASYALSSSHSQRAITSSYAESVSGFVSFPDGLDVTGSLVVTGGITGSISGSIQSASYAATASLLLGSVVSASYAQTASFALNATAEIPAGTVSSSGQVVLNDTSGNLSGSRIVGTVPTATTASFALTASIATSINFIPTTSSFATTSSYARTAETASYFSGSALFENGLTVTGSVQVLGSITGSLSGSFTGTIVRPRVVHSFYPSNVLTGSVQYTVWSGGMGNTSVETLLFTGSRDDFAQFQFRAVGYVTQSAVTMKIGYFVDSGSNGDVVWAAQIAALTPGDAQILWTDTFAVSSSVSGSVPSQSGSLGQVSFSLQNLDGLDTDDFVRLNVVRQSGNASDTVSGSVGLVYVELQYGG